MLDLTIATSACDRTAALADGRVRPEGISLNLLLLPVEEIFWRMLRHGEFDASEASLGGYCVRSARGRDDLVAIPVFLSRAFRHSSIYINERSRIERPEDLAGMRIGVPEYQMTAAVWIRGILKDEYGFRPETATWVQGGLEEAGRTPHEPVRPPGIRLHDAPADRTLSAMLAAGDIDALVSARAPSTFAAGGPVRRLFPEPWSVERDWFGRTGIFPIMHTFVVRKAILDRHPWVAQSLVKAFAAAKDVALDGLRDAGVLHASLPFLSQHVGETVELMGRDYWPYGFEENRATLQRFVDYLADQRLVEGPLSVETLFAPSTLTVARN